MQGNIIEIFHINIIRNYLYNTICINNNNDDYNIFIKLPVDIS